jgi:CDP-2,3-bis-(O-geranylgeranyl)-sn-glycerol synthase
MDFPGLWEAVWFILPAYVANSIAIDVSAVPYLKRFTTPVDFGRSFRGKRILGDGKTWRGLICGVMAGGLCGLLQQHLSPEGLFPMTALIGFLLGLGALVGDMVESFIKRRMGMGRGHPLILMDQLDYIFGAFFFAWIVVPMRTIGWEYLALICAITVPLHMFASVVAWKLKMKKNPW